MSNKGKKYEKPLRLDMSFDEALGRFAQTKQDELPENIKLKKKKKAGSDKDTSSKLVEQKGKSG